MKLTRAEFQAAIEAGIKACPDITDEQKMMLRHVGATADRSLRAWFSDRDPIDGRFLGCPLTLAGLAPRNDVGRAEIALGCANFPLAFDDYTRDKSRIDEWTIEVTP